MEESEKDSLFQDAFAFMYNQRCNREAIDKIGRNSVDSLDISQLITLIEYVNRKRKLDIYRGLPKAMKQLRKVRYLMSHRQPNYDAKEIWDLLEAAYSVFGRSGEIKRFRQEG